MWHMRGIFVDRTYMAITGKVGIAVACVLHTYGNMIGQNVHTA